MNNNCCIDLDVNIQPLALGTSIYDLCRNPPGSAFEYCLHSYVDPNFLNSDLVDLIQNLDLTILWSECFFTNPNQFTVIHVDGGIDGHMSENDDIAKLNFIFDGKDSTMLWYAPKVVNHSITTNSINSKYIRYSPDQVDLVHEAVVGFPSLVQAGIPHNIKNGPEGRFCLSLSFCHDSNVPISMSRAREIFKDFIKSIDE
jgi:hypothetical protein